MIKLNLALLLNLVFLLNFSNFQVYALEDGETVTYFLTDHAGNIDVELDEEGNVLKRYDYLPYGMETPSSDPVLSNSLGYRSEINEDGLYRMGARMYDPEIARFIQRDPMELPEDDKLQHILENPQLLNQFSYGLNNPMTYKDPTGFIAESIWDAGWVLRDLQNLTHVKEGGNVNEALTDLAFDSASLAVPFIPAGIGRLYRLDPKKLEVTVKVSEKDLLSGKNQLYDDIREGVKYMQQGAKKIVTEGAEIVEAAKQMGRRIIYGERVRPSHPPSASYKKRIEKLKELNHG